MRQIHKVSDNALTQRKGLRTEMNVYAVMGEFEYEGMSLLGIYAAYAEAEVQAAKYIGSYDHVYIYAGKLGSNFEEEGAEVTKI